MKTILTLLLSALCLTSIGQTFDVLLYRDTANPDGLPPLWPAQVMPSTNRPAPWFTVTKAQKDAYIESHRAAYESWAAQREAERQAAEDAKVTTRDQLIAGAIARINTDLPRVQNAVANFDTLTTAQRWAVMKELLELIHFMARVQKAQLNNELQ